MKIERVGKEVNWPAGEPVPQSLQEALDAGWEISGGNGGGPDEFSEVGEMWLRKTVGMLALQLTIPYRSSITFGTPEKPTARIITKTRNFAVVDGSVVELHDGSDGTDGTGKVN